MAREKQHTHIQLKEEMETSELRAAITDLMARINNIRDWL